MNWTKEQQKKQEKGRKIIEETLLNQQKLIFEELGVEIL